jgi:hypothetical protein
MNHPPPGGDYFGPTSYRAPHRDNLEPREDFDWAAVDDPIGCVREDLQAIGIPVNETQAKALLLWIAQSQTRLFSITQMTVIERVMLWIGSGEEVNRVMIEGETESQRRNRRLASRTMVALYHLCPHAPNAKSTIRDTAEAVGTSKRTIQDLLENLRGFFRQSLQSPQQ